MQAEIGNDSTGRVSRKLLAALVLAFVFHGALLLAGTFKSTYDAYVHIFFADHYARAWFDNWDYRWYTGFTLTSYPPGSQQSIALLTLLVPGLGLLSAFVIVQLAAVMLSVVGIYRFSRLWVSEEAAGNAALLFVFSSSIGETVHVFGQLPTLFSLGFLLNAVPFAYQWLRTAKVRFLLAAWVLNAGTTAGHHVTTLFGAVFFVAPAIALALWELLRQALPDEPAGQARPSRATRGPIAARLARRILPGSLRAVIYAVGLGVVLIGVVLPYWLWSRSDPITQVSIPHASRDSFITNTAAGLVFFIVPWGVALVGLPYAMYKGLTTRARPLVFALLPLAFLGTGGTTPLPKLLLGGAYDILTLDRFTFWATILALPLLGEGVESLRSGRLARYLREQFGLYAWRSILAALLVAYLGFDLFTVSLTQFRKFQPAPIDMQPIVNFMAKDQHDDWRYLTLGFGDQMAWLSAQMTATTVDGNYHSARRLPELTTTPVERLEGAKFRGLPGIGSLQQFLGVPEKYNLKFIFSNDQFYDPLLYFSGWHRVQRLENGIVVWEREDIPPLPAVLPRKEIPQWQRIMWGTVPMAAVIGALAVLAAAAAFGGRGERAARMGSRLTPAWLRRRVLQSWVRIDRALQMSAARSADPGPDASRAVLLGWRVPLPRAPAPPSARLVRTLLVALIVGGAAAAAVLAMVGQAGAPERVVERYYDDLDFRRFGDAFDKLDPDARPSFAQFVLDRSVKGGLVASYAKLDSVTVTVTLREPDRIEALAHATYVTALSQYSTDQVHILHLRGGVWRLQPEAIDVRVPPDQFFSQPVLAFGSQGRRRVTTGGTAFADVLDRPELKILSARFVRAEEVYSLVGELINTDVDPADVTVTGLLYGPDGSEVAQYNAQQTMLHKLLPKEVTPFRVDFDGSATAIFSGTQLLSQSGGSPGARVVLTATHGLTRPIQIENFAVYAKAVVSGRDLNRGVAAQAMHTEIDPQGQWWLRGELYNSSPIEATVPQVLLTLYDAQGRVAWVQHVYVDVSVRPQRSVAFGVPILAADKVQTLLDQGGMFGNASADDATPGPSLRERLDLPPATGYASARIMVNTFAGGAP